MANVKKKKKKMPLNDSSLYPPELIGDRIKIESQYVASLLNDLTLYEDHNVDPKADLMIEDYRAFYQLGAALYNMGHKTVDDLVADTFLAGAPELRERIERYGGYHVMYEIGQLIEGQNTEGYFEALLRSNMLCRLYDNGIDVLRDINQLSGKTTDEIFDFYEAKISAIALDSSSKIRAIDLSSKELYENRIDEWSKGLSIGFEVGFKLLNYRLAGIHTQNVLLHLAAIGNGKTTSAISLYILPAIESGTDVCVIANEQGEDEWRQMVLATVLFNRIGCHTGMNRHSFLTGGFSQAQREELSEAAAWIDRCPGKIQFIEAQDYSVNAVSRIVRKYSKEGCQLYVVDTFKNPDESSDNAWAIFSESAKELFQIAKHEDVAIVATAQLAPSAMRSKYLDLTSVGKSRAISETATQVVMFRNMDNDEKAELHVYITDYSTGYKQKVPVQLDPNKDYIILFTPKNRFGQTAPQIVYERDMDYNSMKEIGFVDIPYSFS